MLRLFTAAIAFAMLLVSCGKRSSAVATAEGQLAVAAVDSMPMLIVQLQQCSRIYTTEYRIHKIVTHDDVLRLSGNVMGRNISMPLSLGDRKVAIPMDATLKAFVDMSQLSEDNVERSEGRIVVTLPDPQVELTSSKIDQRNIREYVGLVRSHFSDAELASYEQQGREAILQTVPTLGIVATAREHAARVLIPIISQMGYAEEDITVQFRDGLSIGDILRHATTDERHGR